MTCMEMSGSGALMAIPILILRVVCRIRKISRLARSKWFVAAVGSASPDTVGRCLAAKIPLTERGWAISDSASP